MNPYPREKAGGFGAENAVAAMFAHRTTNQPAWPAAPVTARAAGESLTGFQSKQIEAVKHG